MSETNRKHKNAVEAVFKVLCGTFGIDSVKKSSDPKSGIEVDYNGNSYFFQVVKSKSLTSYNAIQLNKWVNIIEKLGYVYIAVVYGEKDKEECVFYTPYEFLKFSTHITPMVYFAIKNKNNAITIDTLRNSIKRNKEGNNKAAKCVNELRGKQEQMTQIINDFKNDNGQK